MDKINKINFHTGSNIPSGTAAGKISEINTVFGTNRTTGAGDVRGLAVEPEKVPPEGSSSPEHLKNAPSPVIKIAGEEKFAAIVVDTENNLLYTYDEKGKAEVVYSVATGKKYTPTRKGIKMMT